MRVFISFLTAFTIWVRLPPASHACDSAGPTPFAVDPALQGIDQQPPALGVVSVVRVQRGKGPQWEGCSYGAGSCDGAGYIVLGGAATDDMTEVDRIGYRFTLVEGTPPSRFTVPPPTFLPTVFDGQIWLEWDDGASDDQESFDFTLSLVAIDVAGNESAPRMVRIADDAGGCTVAAWSRSPRTQGVPIVLLASVTMFVRRRRPRSPE